MAAADQFHEHLDTCDRCRSQPFNLCPEGDRLLAEALARTDLIGRIHQAFTAGPAEMFPTSSDSQVKLNLPDRSLPPLTLEALRSAADLMNQAKPWWHLVGKCQLRPTSYLSDKGQAFLLDMAAVEYWSRGAGEPRYIVLVDTERLEQLKAEGKMDEGELAAFLTWMGQQEHRASKLKPKSVGIRTDLS